MGGDYVTLNQLVTAFNRTGSYSYKMISWVENRGLPVHNQRVQQNTFRVVYLKEFWTWAEKNRSFLDFSKLEPLAFGEEPAWVAEQRKRDFKACSLQRKDPWTPAEDAKLRMLLEQYKYTYEQMSDMLRRSPGAIQRRCADLGLKARPVRINPHGPEAVWHQEDYDRLAEGIKSGESYMSISKALGKSEKAIRGKVYYCYLTENADKVRAMMAGGNWGDGAPEPTVWQARLLPRSRAEMQTTITKFFFRIPTEVQLRELGRPLDDADMMWFFERAIRCDGRPLGLPLHCTDVTTAERIAGRGMQVGSLVSQMTANVVMTPADHYIKRELCAPYYARYMDDMGAIIEGKAAAWELVEEVDNYLQTNLGLNLNQKTAVIPIGNPVEFVGRKISPVKIELRRQTTLGMKKHLRYVQDAYAAGEIDLDYALSVITSYRGLFKDVTSDAFLEKMLDEFVLSRPALEA